MKIHLHECLNDLPDNAQFPNGQAAIDTETQGLKIWRDRLCVVQVANGAGDVWLVQMDGTDWSAPNLKRVLEDASIEKIFHFARFDVAVLKHYLGAEVTPVYCTKIASKLVRTYTNHHGLKAVVEELVGEEMDKYQQSSDWAAANLSDAQKHYAASDVVYLHALKKALDEKLNRTGRMAIFQECCAFLKTRAALDLAGFEEYDIFSHATPA